MLIQEVPRGRRGIWRACRVPPPLDTAMEGAASENAEDLPAPPIGVPLPSGWSGRCVVIEKDVIRWRYQVGLYGADGSFDLVFWDMSGPAGEDVRVGQGFAVTTSDSPDGESLCRPLAAPGVLSPGAG